MQEWLRRETLERREFVLGAGAAAAMAVLLGRAAPGRAQDTFAIWQVQLKKILGDAKPIEGKIAIDLPEIAENGNTVPFSVTVESPMTDADHVKAVHVVSTGNPIPDVASFAFTPASGKASVSSRMRLAKTQDVIAVAELSDGRFLMGKRMVKVTIGGCGG